MFLNDLKTSIVDNLRQCFPHYNFLKRTRLRDLFLKKIYTKQIINIYYNNLLIYKLRILYLKT